MRVAIATSLVLVLAAGVVHAQAPATARRAANPELKWGPAPPVFQPGAEMAVLQGNPGAAEIFTVRLRLPDGYKIAPHTHPFDEMVTVISGTLHLGLGPKAEASGMMTLRAGEFVTAPANQPHYASAKGAVVLQVHAMGPFELTHINPADKPKASTGR
ncbi:MAG: cupin domain-containing protein [Gemmatimonadaceae bacterium]